jgi:uncharacterized FAD-dependent dehydrogenase
MGDDVDGPPGIAKRYEVIIVGAGPAGIFAALEFVRAGITSVAMFEKGHDLDQRVCRAQRRGCNHCPTCAIMTGWGGAGAYSDGKLTLSREIGGWLGEYIPPGALESLLAYVDGLWITFGAPRETHGPDPSAAAELGERAAAAGMTLVPMRLRHIGTDRTPAVLGAMRSAIAAAGVTICTETSVAAIVVGEGGVAAVRLADGRTVEAAAVVAAPGREGADWLAAQARALGVGLVNNMVDVGVRVEVAAAVMEPLTGPLYEAKLLYTTPTFRDRVRTFCMNPGGEVTCESYGDIVTVNGHSYAGRRTGWTNFAVLVSQSFTDPFHEPITYGASVARLANLLGEGILVQRLGDLRAGRRSTPERMARGGVRPSLPSAAPGDLSFVLPYRHLTGILEFLAALDALVPGVAGDDTLLYGVEVKFYSSRLALSPHLETPVRGLYAVGDGAGVTRGLLQSSASGVHAARAVAAALGRSAGA